jgi:hypothetical protein
MVRMVMIRMVGIVGMSAIGIRRPGIGPGVGYYHSIAAVVDIDIPGIDVGIAVVGPVAAVNVPGVGIPAGPVITISVCTVVAHPGLVSVIHFGSPALTGSSIAPVWIGFPG